MLPRQDNSKTILKYLEDVLCQLGYVFIKPQVKYRIQNEDFDLHSICVIYTFCQADILDDTERLQIKIFRK